MSEFLHDALETRNTAYAYIALTRPSADGIAWPILKELNEKYMLGGEFKEAKLRYLLPNGSYIQLYGADKTGWESRLHGLKLAGAAIDEAAFFGVDLHRLIEGAIDPTLTDLQGQLIMTSTPGYLARGYFYDVVHDKIPGWSVHRWTALDNPYMKRQTLETIARKKEINPDIEKDPDFRRNYLGEWVKTDRELVYRYDPVRNVCEAQEPKQGDRHILGLDLGYNDPTAFVVGRWSPHSPDFVILESYKKQGMLLDDIAARCDMYLKYYPGLTIVGDPNQRQTFEELRLRYKLPLLAAQKTDKRYWIEQYNSDLQSGKIRLVADQNSLLSKEYEELTWLTRPNGTQVEKPGTQNDLCDAALYAWRHAYHFAYEEPPPPKTEEQLIVEDLQRKLENQQRPWWDQL